VWLKELSSCSSFLDLLYVIKVLLISPLLGVTMSPLLGFILLDHKWWCSMWSWLTWNCVSQNFLFWVALFHGWLHENLEGRGEVVAVILWRSAWDARSCYTYDCWYAGSPYWCRTAAGPTHSSAPSLSLSSESDAHAAPCWKWRKFWIRPWKAFYGPLTFMVPRSALWRFFLFYFAPGHT
jgi:hypothetical protein